MKNYEKIGDHTIKKFELVSEYAKGWAHKILGYSESAGLIYIAGFNTVERRGYFVCAWGRC